MKPEEINKAIAEKLGWKSVQSKFGELIGLPPSAPVGAEYEFIPDYINFLDACAEFEKITYTKPRSLNVMFGAYVEHLSVITSRDFADSKHWSLHNLHATAPQRCEAFLRMHNLWKE